jgi:excisionase family DNA binding protein
MGGQESAYLTPKEVAAKLQLALSTVYRGLEEGRLPGTKVENRWRTRAADLDALFDRPQARQSDPMPRPDRRRKSRREASVLADVREARTNK